MTRFALIALLVLAPAAALADDLSGTNRFLCAAGATTACAESGGCFEGDAFDLNIPQFVEIDLSKKQMATTKSSARYRTSPIETVKREDGRILVQGSEAGRAFGIVIDEATGRLSATVAADGFGVVAFGVCTPLPSEANGDVR